VRAQVTRTAAAALALAAVVAIVCARFDVEFWWAAFWTTLTAAGYCAVRLALHDYADDARDAKVRARWEAALEDLSDQVEMLEESDDAKAARIRILEAEVSRLAAENAALQRTRNYIPGTPPVSDPTMDDAISMVRVYFENKRVHPTREHMVAHYGWSERRYPPALALLRQRGVVTLLKGNRVRWECADAPTALAMLVSPANPDLQAGDAVSPVATSGEG
jgi:hypothetical protein